MNLFSYLNYSMKENYKFDAICILDTPENYQGSCGRFFNKFEISNNIMTLFEEKTGSKDIVIDLENQKIANSNFEFFIESLNLGFEYKYESYKKILIARLDENNNWSFTYKINTNSKLIFEADISNLEACENFYIKYGREGVPKIYWENLNDDNGLLYEECPNENYTEVYIQKDEKIGEIEISKEHFFNDSLMSKFIQRIEKEINS